MSYAQGIKWTDERLSRLHSLVLNGFTQKEISEILTGEFGEDVSANAVGLAKYKSKPASHYIEIDKDVKLYNEELTLDMDDYMISCDYHSPYHSELWVNRLIAIADVFGIKKHICIGDLTDMDFAKKWYSDNAKDLDQEAKEVKPVFDALDYFDKNYLVKGNHENRVGRLTDGKIQAKQILSYFGKEVWEKKFTYSTYDKLRIADKWLLVHPGSYSRISPAVAKLLAEKYHRNIINSHGHLVGSSYEKSGKFQAIDLGGMFDTRKIEYINKQTSTHPCWKNGCGMLRNGYFWHFTDATDFSFWGIA